MNEWIDVKDRLPDDNEEYLVYTKFKIINIKNFLPFCGEFSEDYVTHWMPLPEPPKIL